MNIGLDPKNTISSGDCWFLAAVAAVAERGGQNSMKLTVPENLDFIGLDFLTWIGWMFSLMMC